MKVLKYLIPTMIAALLFVSTASAQSPMGPGERSPMPRDGHMIDGTSHMEIDGTIVVEDSIILTLTVEPNDEMKDRMDSRHGSMHPSDYTNQIVVSFTSMVEFEDINGDGYSDDDIVISTFILNDQTLTQPELIDDTYYKISSLDGTTFIMSVDLTFEDDIFYGFKWSLNIQYPFESINSSLALIHDIDTTMGRMANRHRIQNGIREGENYQINETRIQDGDEYLPMFFSWVNDVTVDGLSENIITTVVSDNIAISIPQGDDIYYDPGMGVDPSAVENVDGILADLGGFLETIMSPTFIGLILGFGALATIGIYAVSKKKVTA